MLLDVGSSAMVDNPDVSGLACVSVHEILDGPGMQGTLSTVN